MPTLKIKEHELTLKCSVIIDKLLNKRIKTEGKEAEAQKDKLSGGFSKVLPLLIEQDIDGLVYIWEVVAQKNGAKVTTDDVMEAIDARMEELEDATPLFKEVLEAIEEAAFSRNELTKFKKNMKLVSEMKSKDEEEAEKMKLMLKRMDEGYQEITGHKLFEEKQTALPTTNTK